MKITPTPSDATLRPGQIALGSLSLILIAALAACGGGGGSSAAPAPNPTPQAVNVDVPLLFSDGSNEDWGTIGVKLLSLSLTKQDGSSVSVPLGSTPLPLNLAQLNQIGELLNKVTLTAGDTYTGVSLTLSANPGDVSLTVAADPEPGFSEAAGTVIPSSRIQIQGATGAAGALTVTVPVKFDKPLVVPTTPGAAINVEFDLDHPAFLTGHVPVGSTQATWAVNFNGPVKHKKVSDLTRLVMRHHYGKVVNLSSDSSTLTYSKQLPTTPAVSPETATDTGVNVNVLADATNGTLVYDIDAKQESTVKSFASVSAALAAGKYVRVATRYQQNGTLVATRVWISSNFNTVWLSPEGHVLRINNAGSEMVVADENGKPVKMVIDAKTQFFFRTPENALSDTTAIGSGPAFAAAKNLVRGFKVHVQAVDPLASPMVAKTVDIETAAFDGRISSVTAAGFIYTRSFNTGGDGYNVNLSYIDAATANGSDANGNAITGFKYWNWSFPSLVTSGTGAVTSFVSATNGSVDFGGTAGQVYAQGASYARWGDKAAPNGWSAPWVVLSPTNLPLATVASVNNATNSFTITVPKGSKPVTVGYSTTSGSATLAYQVDRSKDQVTVTPQDLSSTAGLAALTQGLTVGARVAISAIPQADGTLKAYTIKYFSGSQQPK
ncbi:DUF5666 domain-containing protein [Roseateles sp.]|uniref:DUF5666 domain-containing protein n=1 Tax=Roseateles sp. TaxID=1971397 RepID=UPI00359FFDB1